MKSALLPVAWAFLTPLAAATGQKRSHPLVTVVSSSTASSNSYDFIIAGGGISGLTIADRLTEDPSVSVLVIEAGKFDSNEDSVLIPGAFFPVPYLWIPLPSVPQAALNGRSFNCPAGKVVGGGSVVNGMVFVRPEKGELETWSELGAKGWTWEDMLPYYKKSENFTAPEPAFERRANFSHIEEVHGYGGPVQTSFPNFFFEGSGRLLTSLTQFSHMQSSDCGYYYLALC
jgi:choline dehydrogenase